MSKSILLIGGNFFPEPTGIGKYNGEMVDWLSNHGYFCTIVTTFPYYPYWKVQQPYHKRRYWYKKEVRKCSPEALPVQIIRCPHYVPENPSGFKRIVSDFSFFFSAFFLIIKFLFKSSHDYIITVAPPFQIGLLAVIYKKFKKTKFLYHIQDLQIEAARDLKMLTSPPLINTLFSIEKYILKHASCISSISLGMIKKVSLKCNREIILYPNWVDTELFHPIFDKRELKKAFGFSPTDKVVLYSGAIGEKQGLEAILHSAKSLEYLADVKFVICGSGPYKEKLQLLKAELGLSNVIFYALQPAARFNQFLNMADIHLVLQKANASDLVMPSKITTILSIGGLAIVTASKGTSIFDIISDSEIGLVIEPENQLALTGAIKDALGNSNTVIKNNARLYAEQHLSIDKIMMRYSQTVFDHNVVDPKTSIKEYSVFSQ